MSFVASSALINSSKACGDSWPRLQVFEVALPAGMQFSQAGSSGHGTSGCIYGQTFSSQGPWMDIEAPGAPDGSNTAFPVGVGYVRHLLMSQGAAHFKPDQ